MEIKMLGDGCSHCRILYSNTLKAIEELRLNVAITEINDILQILRYRVLSTPALVVDGKVVSAGETLSVEKVKEILSLQMFVDNK